MNSNIVELKILKAFDITCRSRKKDNIIQQDWSPPDASWIKCNTDRTYTSYDDNAACGRIFRNSRAENIGCFVKFIQENSAFEAELLGVV